MLDPELARIGLDLAACPTAAGCEDHVIAYIKAALASLPHLALRQDEFGNLIARYEYAATGREPVRLVAHMDHPAFFVQRTEGAAELHFRGGVEERYFAGRKIVFYRRAEPKPLGKAVISGVHFSRDLQPVEVDRPIPDEADFATWDLPRARCTSRLFVSPACDDLVQVATMVALLRRLAAELASACVEALFTRAEEIGFHGALAALKAREPLQPMATVSLEASSARGFARLHAGPIVRVGDRSSVFDSRVTAWLETAFAGLHRLVPETKHQRLLMGGGTCEGTVFHRAGLPTGALCVALRNYHNMGPGGQIRSESVSLDDWQGLYDFLHFLATKAPTLAESSAAIDARFVRLEEKAVAFLGPKM